MFFEKKEDESQLPDLPSPKRSFNASAGIGNPPNMNRKEITLPSFPDTPEENPYPGQSRAGNLVEMEEWHPVGNSPIKEIPEDYSNDEELEGLEEAPQEEYSRQERMIEPPPKARVVKSVQPVADVFVRIDKFHAARKSLTEISERLEDIDDLVKKIRETKLREEQELNSWEKDITHIKARLQTVTENIFEKVE